MNIRSLAVGIAILICHGILPAQPGSWQQRAPFPGTLRVFASTFTIEDKAYVYGGLDPDASGPEATLGDLWEYDLALDLWTQRSPIPEVARVAAASFTLSGKGYICGGLSAGGVLHADLWAYDPLTDSWTQRADLPAWPRESPVAFAVQDVGYLVTGTLGWGIWSELWSYDPANDAWTQRADFPGQRRVNAVGFSLGGHGYVATGADFDQVGEQNDLVDVWAYDPLTDQWQQRADVPGLPRSQAMGCATAQRAFVGGGQHSPEPGTMTGVGTYWSYDPDLDGWSALPPLPDSPDRSGARAFALGHTFFVLGGWSTSGALWSYELEPLPNGFGKEERQNGIADLLLFPNPAYSTITIQGNAPLGRLRLLDTQGRVLYTTRTAADSYLLSVTDLAPGYYLLQVIDEPRSCTLRFVRGSK